MSRQDRPGLNLGEVGDHSSGDYAVRFAFGGAVTVLAGLMAQWYGPVIGGLFLEFPAILPASVTLVTRHHGIEKARDETLGAALGSVGLLAFGALVWQLGERWSPWVLLPIAGLAWLAVSAALWWVQVFVRTSSPTTSEQGAHEHVAPGGRGRDLAEVARLTGGRRERHVRVNGRDAAC